MSPFHHPHEHSECHWSFVLIMHGRRGVCQTGQAKGTNNKNVYSSNLSLTLLRHADKDGFSKGYDDQFEFLEWIIFYSRLVFTLWCSPRMPSSPCEMGSSVSSSGLATCVDPNWLRLMFVSTLSTRGEWPMREKSTPTASNSLRWK